MIPAPIRLLALRLRAILRRRTLEQDMQAEMREHLEQAAARLVARGMSPEDARLAARREFGNVGVVQEEARDARGARWVETFAGDVRFAFRYFARHRVTVAIIVAVLALGTGTNTIIFSVIQAQFFRAAPAVAYDDAQARIWGLERAKRTGRWSDREFTYAEMTALAARRDVFADVTGFVSQTVLLGGRDGTEARARNVQFVSSDFFTSLRVPLAAGRGFTRVQDERGPAELVAVLSYPMATTLFGDAQSAVGRSILVHEVTLRVIGVAPPRFQGALRDMDSEPAAWIPLSARALAGAMPSRWLNESPSLMLVGRLAPGATREDATALVRQVIAGTMPDSAGRVGMVRTAEVLPMRAIPPGDQRQDLVLIFGLAGVGGLLILLVGWMNVSSLMVAAAVGRRQEIAVRLSLGASRARILRQLLTESTLLSLSGGAVGLFVAWAGLTWARSEIGNVDIAPDAGTFLFALALATVTGVLFGLSPAFHATRGAVAGAIRDSSAGSTSRSRLQRTFVATQIALSQPLLVLLAATLTAAITEYRPFSPELARHLVAVDLRPFSKVSDSVPQFVMQHPDVLGAAPYPGSIDAGWIVPPSGGQTSVNLYGSLPGWLDLAGAPILLGRDVALADTTGTRSIPVVIGNDFARALWGEANPLGKTIASPELRGMEAGDATLTVVGVYDASARLPGVAQSGSTVYRAYTARGKQWRSDRVLVRTRPVAEPVLEDIRRLIRQRAPSLPIAAVRTYEQIGASNYQDAIFTTALMGTCGVLALLLASLGLYGVVSLAVQQRTREIGIRIAVGANPDLVTRMFLRSGVRVSVIALFIGLPLSMAALRLSMSQGLDIGDGINVWAIGVEIAVVLLAVAAGATWIPARRAAQVDPALTLRSE